MKPFELIIFDCDGVLVDSELITNRVFMSLVNELGLTVTLEDMFEQFVGRSMEYCVNLVEDMLGDKVPADFVDTFQQKSKEALESELKAVPGIESALDAIDIPFCVASSGSHEKMKTTLGITGLYPRFEGKMFSVTEVEKGKPAPDVFLLAADRFGASPETCAVVEDTPTGVTAGVAAGMTVFGYSALTPAHRLLEAGADRVFDTMGKLPNFIKTSRDR
jgi:HAD superfamily hydrolase (TIGR01509 family)